MVKMFGIFFFFLIKRFGIFVACLIVVERHGKIWGSGT